VKRGWKGVLDAGRDRSSWFASANPLDSENEGNSGTDFADFGNLSVSYRGSRKKIDKNIYFPSQRKVGTELLSSAAGVPGCRWG